MSGKYQAYPEYKDSGVEWIGPIPAEWSMLKLTHAYDAIGSGTTPPTNEEEWYGGDIPWVTTGELRERVIYKTTKYITNGARSRFPTLRLYPEGSVAIAMYGATIGRLGIFGVQATTNQACCVLASSKKVDNQYVFYWLQAFRDDIVRLSSGGGQPNINQEKVASLKVSAPCKDLQRIIAAFLDHETARIDRLIEKQQRLIELLKEKRQAVISHAVTKGLDPNVPMKDSGVEWLGQVPEHWGVLKIRYVTKKVTTGGTPTDKDAFVESEGVCWFTPGDFKENIELKQANKKVSYDSVSTGDAKLYPKNSVVMVGIGATLGKVGFITHQFSANQQINILVPNNNTSALFLSYAISAQFEQIRLAANASTLGIINQDKTKQIIIAVPPYDEQLFIQGYLSSFDLQTGKALDKSALQISLLQERRTALISAAVTGKIDVRGWQPPAKEGAA